MTDPTSPGALEAILADPSLQYRFLVEESSDVLAVHDPDGRLRWISPAIERMVGWTAEERMSGAAPQLIHPDDQHAVHAVNERLRAGAESGSARVRLMRRDGSHLWALSTARAWRDSDGEIAALVVVTHDIDEIVQAEQERHQVEALYRMLAENVDDVVLQTVDGVIQWVSPSVTAVLGWQPEDLVGKPAWEYMHPDDVRPVQDDAARVHAGLSMSGRARAISADGSYRWFARTQRPVVGAVTSHVTGLRDVHDQVRAELRLIESEAHFRVMAESAAHFTLRVDADGLITWVSPSVETVLGWAPAQMVGTRGADYVHRDHHEEAAPSRTALRAGSTLSGRTRVRRADGSHVWLSQVATPLHDEQGAYLGTVAGFQDVDAAVRAEHALAVSEERFRLAMAAAPAGMALTDLDRHFTVVNPALCRMLEADEEWLLAHRMSDVLHPDDDGDDLRLRAALLGGEERVGSLEARLLTRSGTEIWVQKGLALLRDDEGRPTGFVSHLVDVTETRVAREELRELATHDQLTGALNRVPLEESLERLLSHPARAGRLPAVLYIDVDGLRQVNNAIGHGAGDLLLATIATRVRGQLRADDVLSRVGGDEFVVVLPGVESLAAALLVCDKLHQAVGEPVDVGHGAVLTPTISIGVAMASEGRTAPDVIEEADQALLVAKRNGRHGTASGGHVL